MSFTIQILPNIHVNTIIVKENANTCMALNCYVEKLGLYDKGIIIRDTFTQEPYRVKKKDFTRCALGLREIGLGKEKIIKFISQVLSFNTGNENLKNLEFFTSIIEKLAKYPDQTEQEKSFDERASYKTNPRYNEMSETAINKEIYRMLVAERTSLKEESAIYGIMESMELVAGMEGFEEKSLKFMINFEFYYIYYKLKEQPKIDVKTGEALLIKYGTENVQDFKLLYCHMWREDKTLGNLPEIPTPWEYYKEKHQAKDDDELRKILTNHAIEWRKRELKHGNIFNTPAWTPMHHSKRANLGIQQNVMDALKKVDIEAPDEGDLSTFYLEELPECEMPNYEPHLDFIYKKN